MKYRIIILVRKLLFGKSFPPLNLTYIPQLHELHPLRAKLINQCLQVLHALPPSNCITISSISFLSCSSLATISEMRVFNSTMSIFSRVSSCST